MAIGGKVSERTLASALKCSTQKGRKSKPTYQDITEGSHNLESKKK